LSVRDGVTLLFVSMLLAALQGTAFYVAATFAGRSTVEARLVEEVRVNTARHTESKVDRDWIRRRQVEIGNRQVEGFGRIGALESRADECDKRLDRVEAAFKIID
jgi:hypothetical protein